MEIGYIVFLAVALCFCAMLMISSMQCYEQALREYYKIPSNAESDGLMKPSDTTMSNDTTMLISARISDNWIECFVYLGIGIAIAYYSSI